jgi:hypothetical protein
LQHLGSKGVYATFTIQGPENGAGGTIEIPDGCRSSGLRLLATEFEQEQSPLISLQRGGVL